MKDILEKAIGKPKTFPERESDEYDAGYQACQAEMRAKIPQIVEEVVEVIKKCRLPQNTTEDGASTLCYIPNEDFNVAINDRLEWIIKSLTVEKKSDEDNKGV